MHKPKSLRDLLLIHELFFITLVLLAVAGGAYGIYLWDKSAQESQRIHLLVQEIQQTRGDLYRQMKELFDSTFLNDVDARSEYQHYTLSILKDFSKLKKLATGNAEKTAIAQLETNYLGFVKDAPLLFARYQASPNDKARKTLYHDMETGIFARYEAVSKHAEDLLKLKQAELKSRLDEAKRVSFFVLGIPIFLAVLLLILSRAFLRRNILHPIHDMMRATNEISSGNLHHKAPEAGAAELATLSKQINQMAENLADSRDALVQSEKQAALGLLVPMLAHNIRNPLASIRATAQMIDIPAQDNDGQESVAGIISTVDRLERWTTGLLAYLHPTKPQLGKAKLENIVQGALLPLKQKVAEKRITLNLAINPAISQVLTDEHLLEQALYNLILNAIEASPSDSQIDITANLQQDVLMMTIADQGAGMPFTPEPRSSSLSPTTKRFGTGLGIPFTFKACEVLGGTISFENRTPNGTLVRLQLPQ